MIECTDLFPDASWAVAHIHSADLIRINVQYTNSITLLHVRISEIKSFFEKVSEEHSKYRAHITPPVDTADTKI